MQFQFQSTKKDFDVLNKEGELLKKYYIDVGQIDTFRNIIKKFNEMKEPLEEVQKGSITKNLADQIMEQEKEIVTILLDDWDYLWEKSGYNVLNMLLLVKGLIDLVNKVLNEQKI
jgi:Cdc6-like AAA superfamily ATPase